MTDMDSDNLRLIEFTKTLMPGVNLDMVAIFNQKVISKEDVRQRIQDGMSEFDTNLIVVTKTTYEAVFGSLRTAENPTDIVLRFLSKLPDRKIGEYEYQAKHKGEWLPVSRINKRKKTFALSHNGGELVVPHTDIEDVKDYLAD